MSKLFHPKRKTLITLLSISMIEKCSNSTFAMDASFSDLVIEGDNFNVMKSISLTKNNLSRLGLVYEDIRCIVASLWTVAISCVHRAANSAAHSLARYACQIDDEIVWLEESPSPALEALYLDSSFLNH